MAEFGVPHWKVTVLYAFVESVKDEPSAAAECSSHFEYEQATITLNRPSFQDEDAAYLEMVIEHELAHIVHSPFLILMDMAKEVLPAEQYNMLWVGWHRAQEMTVRNIERMIHSLRESKQ